MPQQKSPEQGSWSSFQDFDIVVDNPTQYTNGTTNLGVQDLYLVFKGGSIDLFNVKEFSFSNTVDVLDPYNTVKAIDYDGQSGTQLAINNTVVGFIGNDDYIFFEDVDFAAGPITGTVNASSNSGGGQIEFRTGSIDGDIIATAEITRTGSWSSFEDFNITVIDPGQYTNGSTVLGIQDLYLVFKGTSIGGLFNVNEFSFSPAPTTPTLDPYNTVKAIDFDDQSGIQPANNNTVVGFINNNDYIVFENVDFDLGPLSGMVNASSNNNGGQIEFRIGGIEGTLIATANITNTGGWRDFADFDIVVDNPGQYANGSTSLGVQDLYLIFKGGSGFLFDVNEFVFNPATISNIIDPYSTVKAINYDGQSGTQLAINNTVVGFIGNDDYIFFEDVDFDLGPITGTVSASSNSGGGQIEFRTGSVDGDLIATAEISNTGGWSSFQNFDITVINPTQYTDGSASLGVQDLYLVFKGSSIGGLFNVNEFIFEPAEIVTPSPLNILIFHKTNGFRHSSINNGIQMINGFANSNDWTVQDTQESSVFNSTTLADVDVVIFLNTSGNNLLTDSEQDAFEQFIQNGGGFVGVHAATDTYRNGSWPWYNELVGAIVQTGPNHTRNNFNATMDVVGNHPAVEHLGATWNKSEEYYYWELNGGFLFDGNIDLLRVRSTGNNSYDAPRPITWYKEYDGGRSFYTALGHNGSDYSNDNNFITMMEQAILWAGGEVDVAIAARNINESLFVHDHAEEEYDELNVYPMPFGSTLTLKQDNHDPYQVRILDVKGNTTLLEQKGEGEQLELDMSQIKSPGFYILEVVQDGVVKRMKILKE